MVGGGAPAARRPSRARPVSQTGDWHASGRRRSPSSTRKPFQPSRPRRTYGESGPWPRQASAISDQTHGGWIPPQLPSSSCRSMIQRSAAASARSRPGFSGDLRVEREQPVDVVPDVAPRPLGPARESSSLPRARRGKGPDRSVVHDDRERNHGLARPAGEGVGGDRRPRRQRERARAESAARRPRATAPRSANQIRVKTRAAPMPPRSSTEAPGLRELRGLGGETGQPERRVGLHGRVEVGLAAVVDRPEPVGALPAEQLGHDRRTSSRRRGCRRNSQKKRCSAVIVTFDSSSPTHQPPGRWSSSRRAVTGLDRPVECADRSLPSFCSRGAPADGYRGRPRIPTQTRDTPSTSARHARGRRGYAESGWWAGVPSGAGRAGSPAGPAIPVGHREQQPGGRRGRSGSPPPSSPASPSPSTHPRGRPPAVPSRVRGVARRVPGRPAKVAARLAADARPEQLRAGPSRSTSGSRDELDELAAPRSRRGRERRSRPRSGTDPGRARAR